MPNPVWPVTLPNFVQESGYSEKLPSLAIETSMDTGPGKTRKRFTTNVRPFGFAVKMSAAQLAIFDNFYVVTLAGGTLKFDWVHPRTRAPATFQMRLPPPAIRAEGEAVVVTMTMEMVP